MRDPEVGTDLHRAHGRDFDVIIIGGGLLGCAAAYYLSQAGLRAALVERDQINRQASGQNAGSLHFQLEHRAMEHGDEIARLHALQIPLNLDAQERWAGLEGELGAPLEVVQKGGLMVAESRDDLEVLRRKADLEKSRGLECELITGDEARDLVPGLSGSVLAALFHPREGHANPRLVGPAFLRAALKTGAEVFSRTRVVAVRRMRGRYVVRVKGTRPRPDTHHVRRAAALTEPPGFPDSGIEDWNGEEGELSGEVVLNCAGVWIPEIAAMLDVRMPMVPVALQVHCTDAAPMQLDYLLQHAGGRLSMKQVCNGNFLVGGGWPSRMVTRWGRVEKGRRARLRTDSVIGNLSLAARIWPKLQERHLIRAWTGMTALTVDQVPLLGEIAGRPGVYVMGGGSAFTLGPTYAYLMSRLIAAGEAPLDIRPFSPHRFAHLTF